MASRCSYLEELIVGGGLAQAAAVLDGLLELGGFGDHVCGWRVRFGSLLIRWSVVVLVGSYCREELESGMPDDVICNPQSLELWTAGLIIFTGMVP